QVMLISTGGTVIRMPVEGIRRAGRSTQGVIVMRLRGDEIVSTLAPVAESTAVELEAGEAEDAPIDAGSGNGAGPPPTSVLDDPGVEDDEDEPAAEDEPEAEEEI
ncbi:MAG: hypothetical protein H0T39_05540, partial [Actinobacteria bacterium]|nr:hypothetical protein [Actinomycetota bacterium]